jgi:hypothetical protein
VVISKKRKEGRRRQKRSRFQTVKEKDPKPRSDQTPELGLDTEQKPDREVNTQIIMPEKQSKLRKDSECEYELFHQKPFYRNLLPRQNVNWNQNYEIRNRIKDSKQQTCVGYFFIICSHFPANTRQICI